MSLATSSFVTYDNPSTLADLCSVSIVRNIENFVNEAIISDKTFYLWKEGISFNDGTIEQLFQTVIHYRGELDARWLTLFFGSKLRARQLITALVSEPDELLLSSVDLAESPFPAKRKRTQLCISTSSNFNNVAVANGNTRETTIDSNGVLRQVVIPRNVAMPEPALLAGLLEASEPLEITLEDCSNFGSKLRVLELIAAHCPRLIILKLYRCGSLLTECFKRFPSDSPLSPRAMEQFASGLDLSHLRVLALCDLPAAATTPHACLLLEQLSDRLAPHLVQLDLSGADFSVCASFGWLSRLQRLRVLLLADCRMPSDRAPLLAAICSLSLLTRLDLQHLYRDYDIDLNDTQRSHSPFKVCPICDRQVFIG